MLRGSLTKRHILNFACFSSRRGETGDIGPVGPRGRPGGINVLRYSDSKDQLDRLEDELGRQLALVNDSKQTDTNETDAGKDSTLIF